MYCLELVMGLANDNLPIDTSLRLCKFASLYKNMHGSNHEYGFTKEVKVFVGL